MRRADAVVLALIFLTAGALFLAAIARARESARRADCARKLQQIGSALPNYQATYHHFPLAALPSPDLPPEKRLSWLAALAPYLEPDGGYYRIDPEKAWDSPENLKSAAHERPHWYRCPSATDTQPTGSVMPTSYVGIAGIGADAAELPAGDPKAGFFGYGRKITPADLKGRGGMILVAAETARVEGCWTAGGRPTVRGIDRRQLPYLGAGGQFGGLHRGGVNVLFADGSVRFLAADAPPEAFEGLATLRGGE